VRDGRLSAGIPDFSSPKAKLIIELDSFWNNDVMKDIESVIRAILFAIESGTQ